MADSDGVRVERAQNLWASFERKFEPVARATGLDPDPQLELSKVGGLAGAKEEILTYACAATDPAVYGRWGTYPPSGLLLIGQRGVGKRLLAKSLATLTRSAFLCVTVPRLVLEVMHEGGKVGELVGAWSQTLSLHATRIGAYELIALIDQLIELGPADAGYERDHTAN